MKRRLIWLLLLWFIAPIGTFACSCAWPGPMPCGARTLGPNGVLFVGTVTHIDNPAPDDGGLGGTGEAHYRFHIDEAFGGTVGAEVDVYSGRGGADCSYHFEQGKKYLVSPYEKDDGRLFATIWSITRPFEQAQAKLAQLRAMRDHQRVASVYGVLSTSEQPYDSVTDNTLGEPLGNTRVVLRSNGQIFETVTDSNGVYATYDVPGGEYHFSAELPENLELAETIVDNPLPPLKLPADACYEYDVDALPTGSIRG